MKVKIDYIYNSGFTIETENYFLVIDYYTGDLEINTDKELVFLVTHGHEDHYTKDIFKYKDKAKYIISFDVDGINEDENIKIVKPYDSLNAFGLDLNVFGSTDEGSSYYFSVDGIKFFHSGDHNWWAWEDMGPQREIEREAEYKTEIDKLYKLNQEIDIAFVPVDPRLKHNYYLAGKYFIEKIKPKYFIPMHFGNIYDYNEKFIKDVNLNDTVFLNINEKGQEFQIELWWIY